MRKRLLIGVLITLLLSLSAYLYLRYGILKSKDYQPDTTKARSSLDLRPALIARLQQLVRNGSDSLYVLAIDSLNPDLAASTLDATGVSLRVDSAGYRRLAQLQRLPDDIYSIRFASLHIDGIGIEDLIHAKDIRITGFHFKEPQIEVWQKAQPYNAAARKAAGRQTLFQRLTKDVRTIAVGNISLEGASYVAHDAARNGDDVTFKNVTIRLDDILVDSSTQFDADRVLFAKHTAIECQDYSIITPDSLYLFKIGSIAISGERHTVVAGNISLEARGGRQRFERSIRTQQEMYSVSLPRITLTGADWQALMHGKRCIADAVRIDGGKLLVYLDKSMPESPGLKADNFPQQMLVAMQLPVAIKSVQVHNLDVAYEEYDPIAKSSGVVTFNSITGHGENLTNISTEIAKHPAMSFNGNALFMNHAAMSGVFSFMLPKAARGAFTAYVRMGETGYELINAFAGEMGGVIFTGGKMETGEAHFKGDNYHISGDISVRYAGLHVDPIKKGRRDADGNFRTRHVSSFLANAVLIKNANPGRFGGLREPKISLDRGACANFFNFSWNAIKSGLLKTIGIPQRLGM